jgi:hypothetical protein
MQAALTNRTFSPQRNPVQALFDLIYEVKFSRHVPLTVVLLSAVYAVFRSQHYLSAAFKLPAYVSVPTAVFLELLVLGASAATFIAARAGYVAELKREDENLSLAGVTLALLSLIVAFVAMLGVAWADAQLVTNDAAAALLMTLAQATQGLFIVSFIIQALLDERARLRVEFARYQREQTAEHRAQLRPFVCPFCESDHGTPNALFGHTGKCGAAQLVPAEERRAKLLDAVAVGRKMLEG